jgi:hypothetical protein
MKIKAKFEKMKKMIAAYIGWANKMNDNAEYEYCVFFDTAAGAHTLVHRKLSQHEGLQITKIERWSVNHFVEIAA